MLQPFLVFVVAPIRRSIRAMEGTREPFDKLMGGHDPPKIHSELNDLRRQIRDWKKVGIKDSFLFHPSYFSLQFALAIQTAKDTGSSVEDSSVRCTGLRCAMASNRFL